MSLWQRSKCFSRSKKFLFKFLFFIKICYICCLCFKTIVFIPKRSFSFQNYRFQYKTIVFKIIVIIQNFRYHSKTIFFIRNGRFNSKTIAFPFLKMIVVRNERFVFFFLKTIIIKLHPFQKRSFRFQIFLNC